MPRLFTGIEIPADIALDLSLLKGGVPGARWIDQDAYHITLRFIGDVSTNIANEIDERLDRLSETGFDLQLSGIGQFGNSKPRAIYARVEPCPALNHLQAIQERICRLAGLKPEGRKFIPHVTLARLGKSNADAVSQFASRNNLYSSRRFSVTRFVMYSSRPSRGGGPYVVENTYELTMQDRISDQGLVRSM